MKDYKDYYVTENVSYEERLENVELLIDLTNLVLLNNNKLYTKYFDNNFKHDTIKKLTYFLYNDQEFRKKYDDQTDKNLTIFYKILYTLTTGQVGNESKYWDLYAKTKANNLNCKNALAGALKIYLGKEDEIKPLGFNVKKLLNNVIIDKNNHTIKAIPNAMDYANAMSEFVKSLQGNKEFNDKYTYSEDEKNL